MRRRDFITLLGGAAAGPLAAHAQQQDGRASALLLRILQLRADTTADKIAEFLNELVGQIGWTTQLPWSNNTVEQRHTDAQRMLKQLPPITELVELDATGKQQLRVSRIATDLVGTECLLEVPPLTHQAPTHQKVGGIGIGVIVRDGLIRVVTSLDGTPADKAGILANDIITKVDGDPVQGLTLDQAVEKMHGPVGTKITLTIVRMGEDKPIDLTITREPIPILAAESWDPSTATDSSKCRWAAADWSKKPEFTEAVAHSVYYGPVYFRKESEPYMTLALAGTRRDAGVSVAEVNLKLILDVEQIKLGEHGAVYVVDREGRLIAHPDFSLVVRKTDMSQLAQVQAARAAGSGPTQVHAARDINGRDVLSASAIVDGPGWYVFVELPLAEADTAVP